MKLEIGISAISLAFLLAGCSSTDSTDIHKKNQPHDGQSRSMTQTLSVKRPDHVVIVIEENHSYAQIANHPQASYINSLMRTGASFTNYHAVAHPSEPNYLSLFSGQNQGVTDDSCPHSFTGSNLASSLHSAGLTFGGYCEDLPVTGYTGCSNQPALWHFHGTYARKHNPWVNFTNVYSDENMPFSKFPSSYNQLPTIAFVIPNLQHDMHDGSILAADKWLKGHIGPYVDWAKTHNSLLIITWDEDDDSAANQVPAILVGPMIQPAEYDKVVNHYSLLRTIEDMYHLPYLGKSAEATPLF